jgi:hypothetical protein
VTAANGERILMGKITKLKTSAASAPVLTDVSKIMIKPPRIATAKIKIKGTAPYLQNKFSSENKQKMEAKQKEGSSQARTRRAKPPKDFQKIYESSMHVSQEGWHGIPASGLRQAMIDACRLTEMDMIRAKMCLRIVADGLDRENLEPLVRITKGAPEMHIDRVKIGINQTDLAVRALFREWEATITVQWDDDIFKATDIVNLIARAGWQVGVGAGRPLSKNSGGTGKGTFEVEG